MASSRSGSEPDPVSMRARPAVAWGRNAWTRPSPPAERANSRTASVTSTTRRPVVSIETSLDCISGDPPTPRAWAAKGQDSAGERQDGRPDRHVVGRLPGDVEDAAVGDVRVLLAVDPREILRL